MKPVVCRMLVILLLSFTTARAESPANLGIFGTFAALQSVEVDLCVVRIPVREELYESKERQHWEVRSDPHPLTLAAQESERWLRQRGIPVIDLAQSYRLHARERELFAEDRFHLCDVASKPLADTLLEQLEALPEWQAARTGNVVVIGECFAESFGRQLSSQASDRELRMLIKYSGGSQVHNHLFAFEDDYLAEADLVVWIQSNPHFSNPRFQPLASGHRDADLQPRTAKVKAELVPQLTREEAEVLPYPNALRASTFRDLETGERFVGIHYLVKDRQLALARKLRQGRDYRLSLVPMHTYSQEHEDVRKTCLIDRSDDLDLPRYWIKGWYDLPPSRE